MTTKKGTKETMKNRNSYMSNADIWSAMPALNQLMSQRFHVRVSMDLAKLAIKLKPAVEAIEKVRKNLVQQYQEKDDDGKMVVKPGENMVKFIEEWNDLLEQPSDVKQPNKVKIPDKVGSSCEKCKNNMMVPFEVEASIIMALEKFIDIVEAK